MIQNSAGLSLDLDIVADVFPLENGSLTLDDGNVVIAISVTSRATSRIVLEVVSGLCLGDLVTTTEDEDLALGLGRGNEFGGGEIDCHKTNHEDPEDTKVTPLVRALVLIC